MKPKDFVGGRGKKVDYQTEMFRIPTLLKPTIQQIGLQFRILWNGLSDPRGESLISRLQVAIPDCEQPAVNNVNYQISSKQEVLKPDSKFKEDEEVEETDKDEIEDDEPEQTEAEQLRFQVQRNIELTEQVNFLLKDSYAEREKLNELRSQLAEQTAKAARRQEEAQQPVCISKVLELLENAITSIKKGGTYEYNNASKLKTRVEEALKMLRASNE